MRPGVTLGVHSALQDLAVRGSVGEPKVHDLIHLAFFSRLYN